MRFKLFCGVILAATTSFVSGCVTTNQTRGYQTNPPVKSNAGIPPNFGKQNSPKKNVLASFFEKVIPQSKPHRKPDPISDDDATSLNNKPNVNAELFVVAGEMGIESQAYDTAEGYFKRALKIEPENIRASLGLAKIYELKGQNKKAVMIYQALKKRYPNDPQLLNWLGESRIDQPRKAPLVTMESLADAIAAIGNMDPDSTITGPSDPPVNASEIMVGNGIALNSEIEIKTRGFQNRLNNPYLDSGKASNAEYLAQTNVIEYRPGRQEEALYGYLDDFSSSVSGGKSGVSLASADSEEEVAVDDVESSRVAYSRVGNEVLIPRSLKPSVIQFVRPKSESGTGGGNLRSLSDDDSSRRDAQ